MRQTRKSIIFDCGQRICIKQPAKEKKVYHYQIKDCFIELIYSLL